MALQLNANSWHAQHEVQSLSTRSGSQCLYTYGKACRRKRFVSETAFHRCWNSKVRINRACRFRIGNKHYTVIFLLQTCRTPLPGMRAASWQEQLGVGKSIFSGQLWLQEWGSLRNKFCDVISNSLLIVITLAVIFEYRWSIITT